MDKNKAVILEKRVSKVIENLQKNNMLAFYVQSKEEVISKIKKLIKEGDTVGVGGSATLSECGVLALLRNGKYNFLDRYKEGLSREEIHNIFIQSFAADAYLCSSNAITENGELYNVDGNSNRVAAILYGPKSVIMIAGINKIVKDIDEAVVRVKKLAAPANCSRLGSNTYCNAKGECQAFLLENPNMTSGCESPARICCNYVVSAKQRHKDRIKVIIVGEELGY